jgi:hypothetical protein
MENSFAQFLGVPLKSSQLANLPFLVPSRHSNFYKVLSEGQLSFLLHRGHCLVATRKEVITTLALIHSDTPSAQELLKKSLLKLEITSKSLSAIFRIFTSIFLEGENFDSNASESALTNFNLLCAKEEKRRKEADEILKKFLVDRQLNKKVLTAHRPQTNTFFQPENFSPIDVNENLKKIEFELARFKHQTSLVVARISPSMAVKNLFEKKLELFIECVELFQKISVLCESHGLRKDGKWKLANLNGIEIQRDLEIYREIENFDSSQDKNSVIIL